MSGKVLKLKRIKIYMPPNCKHFKRKNRGTLTSPTPSRATSSPKHYFMLQARRLSKVCFLHLNQIHAFKSAATDNDSTQMLQVLRKNDLKQIRSTHLPEDVKTTVLFLKQRSIALHLRIRRLEAENIAERTNYKELHRAQNRLERAKHAKEAQIVHLGSKCEDLQMLK